MKSRLCNIQSLNARLESLTFSRNDTSSIHRCCIIPQLLIILPTGSGLICCFPAFHSLTNRALPPWSVGGELGLQPLLSFSPWTIPQLIQILRRRKPTCQIESKLHYKSPVTQTTREVARKTHALYCVLVGLSGLDKQTSGGQRPKSDTSAPTPTVSHRSTEWEEVALFAWMAWMLSRGHCR